MSIRHRVELSQSERDELTVLLSGGRHPARKPKRARVPLAADAGAGDGEIAAHVVAGGSTASRAGRRFVPDNPAPALSGAPRGGAARKPAGKEEALPVAAACPEPPEGCSRRTLAPLPDEAVKLTGHESLSRGTARRRPAENRLKPWRKDMWCIPEGGAAYVAAMEDVPGLHGGPPGAGHPVIRFDESATRLIGEVRAPIPAEPGRRERFDLGYRRNGTADLFVLLDARRPRRKVKVTGRRAAADFAACMREPGDIRFPEAGKVRVVPDNRATRGPIQHHARVQGRARAATPGVPLHPQARRPAQHGRDRDRRPARPVPRPSGPQLSKAEIRNRRLGTAARQKRRENQMDVLDGQGQDKNGARISKAD